MPSGVNPAPGQARPLCPQNGVLGGRGVTPNPKCGDLQTPELTRRCVVPVSIFTVGKQGCRQQVYAPLPAAAAGAMLFFLADFPNFPLLTSPAAPVTLALHKERGCGGCGQLPAMWAAARPEGWGLGAVLTPLNPPSWAVLTPLNLPPIASRCFKPSGSPGLCPAGSAP